MCCWLVIVHGRQEEMRTHKWTLDHAGPDYQVCGARPLTKGAQDVVECTIDAHGIRIVDTNIGNDRLFPYVDRLVINQEPSGGQVVQVHPRSCSGGMNMIKIEHHTMITDNRRKIILGYDKSICYENNLGDYKLMVEIGRIDI